MMYLPDTNVLIVGVKKKESPEAFFLRNCANKSVLSVIVISEFLSKASLSEEKMISRLRERIPILDITEDIAVQAGKYRKAWLKKKSKGYLIDCYLAAQAKLHNLTLVTNNTRDFQFKGIKVVSPKDIV